MKFKLVSDGSRQVHPNMDLLNAYASRFRPGVEFQIEITCDKEKFSGDGRIGNKNAGRPRRVDESSGDNAGHGSKEP